MIHGQLASLHMTRKMRSDSRHKPKRMVSYEAQQGRWSLVIVHAAPSFVILNRLSFGCLALMMMNNGVLVTNVSFGHSWKETNKSVMQ